MIQLGVVPNFEDTGLAPYRIQGDPVVALIAQLNRFAGSSYKVGTGCSARRYVSRVLPLMPTLTDEAATAANILLYDRYNCVSLDTWGKQKAKWALDGMNDSIPFVLANLEEITLTIAQVGDALDLAPASVGITNVDPRLKPKVNVGAYVGGAAAVILVGLLGYQAYTRRAR